MSRTQNIKLAIQNAKICIEERDDHHLILPLRKALWLAYGPIEMLEDNEAVKNEGYECRIELALATCKKVLPIWEKHLPDADIAQEAIQVAVDYIAGKISFDDAFDEANDFQYGLSNAQDFTDEQLNALLVGHACVNLIYVALADNIVDDIDELDENLDNWDYAMYAAGAYSGGFPFNNNEFTSDPEKLKEFWVEYLNKAETLI